MDELTKVINEAAECPFRLADHDRCHARPKVCGCKPERGRKFPRRCPLRLGPVVVARAEAE